MAESVFWPMGRSREGRDFVCGCLLGSGKPGLMPWNWGSRSAGKKPNLQRPWGGDGRGFLPEAGWSQLASSWACPQWARLKASRPGSTGLTGSVLATRGCPGPPQQEVLGGEEPQRPGPRTGSGQLSAGASRRLHSAWGCWPKLPPHGLELHGLPRPQDTCPEAVSEQAGREPCAGSAPPGQCGADLPRGLGSLCRPSTCRATLGARVQPDPPSPLGWRQRDAQDPGPEPQEEARPGGGRDSWWEPRAWRRPAACRRPWCWAFQP